MLDCTTCEHRIEKNPQYMDRPFYELPCHSCPLMVRVIPDGRGSGNKTLLSAEPHETEPHNLAQLDYVETRSAKTIGSGFLDTGKHNLPSEESAKLVHKAKTLTRAQWLTVWDFFDSTTASEQALLLKSVKFFSRPEWEVLHCAMQEGFTVTQTTLAKRLGVTKQAVNATIDTLCGKVPSLSALMQKQKRDKRKKRKS